MEAASAAVHFLFQATILKFPDALAPVLHRGGAFRNFKMIGARKEEDHYGCCFLHGLVSNEKLIELCGGEGGEQWPSGT